MKGAACLKHPENPDRGLRCAGQANRKRAVWRIQIIDKRSWNRLVEAVMRPAALSLILSFLVSTAANSVVGGGSEVPGARSQPEVMIVGDRGNFCTGTAIARDLVLTAAHCVLPGANYMLLDFGADGAPSLKKFTMIARHPRFDLQTLLAHRATADIALLKLETPLSLQPAAMLPPRSRVAVGERFVLRGYGVAKRGDGSTGGKLRTATLAATGQPGNLQLRLIDPAAGGTRFGLGACTGDSGAPLYQETTTGRAIIGLVSWSTGPNGETGCGGLTGVTPLELYRSWIDQQAKSFGVQ
jgi:secreted trypsin-like serine protease